jgi:hypothetical protein
MGSRDSSIVKQDRSAAASAGEGYDMTTLLLAVGLVSTLVSGNPERKVGVFSAMVRAVQPAPDRFLSATGGVDITISDESIKYTIQLARMPRVTNVVLLARGITVSLYAGPVSAGDVLEYTGEIPARIVEGITLPELTQRLLREKAEIVVFTEEVPTGNLRGRLTGKMVEENDAGGPAPVAYR